MKVVYGAKVYLCLFVRNFSIRFPCKDYDLEYCPFDFASFPCALALTIWAACTR